MICKKKTKIITIMPHGPAYHYLQNKKPDVFWKKHDGTLVGFWTHEWLDILGDAILKNTDNYEYEVWQPDYRADKIYSKTLETGVTHSLFPAEDKIFKVGIRRIKGIFSNKILERLKELNGQPLIVMFYGTYGFRLPFYFKILKAFDLEKKFPIFLRSGGMFKSPLGEIWALHKPLTYLSLLIEHFEVKKIFRNVDMISEQSKSALAEVGRVYKGRIEKLTMGCDFDFWKPVVSPEIKKTIQSKLNISDGKKVFFASGNFVERKQLDKLLEVFKSLKDRNDFFIIIAGQGDKAYTDKLVELAKPLVNTGNAIIHPFVTGEELRDIYWASDMYISTATDEGGPASVMKAMGCGLPVISTPVGETADTMRQYNVGKIIPTKNHRVWKEVIETILNGNIPKVLDIDIARSLYDWENVAKRFISAYDYLNSMYYERK